MRIDRAYQQATREFFICTDVYFILIDTLSLYGVLQCFFNNNVDYYISLSMLLHTKILQRYCGDYNY